jgi:hypothetical protein
MADDLDARTKLTEALWNNPETRPLMEAATVKAFPQAKSQMPHLVLEEKFQAEAAALRKDREDFQQERQQELNRRAWSEARSSIMSDGELHIAEAELPEVEALMNDPHLGPLSHRAAATLYRSRQHVATPRGSVYDFSADVPGLRGAGGDEFKGIMEDSDAWARQKTGEILTDFAKGNGAKWM